MYKTEIYLSVIICITYKENEIFEIEMKYEIELKLW